MSEKKLIEEIHECLVGNKLTGHKGIIDKVDCLDRKISLIENRLHTIEKQKSKPVIFKLISALFKAKTGI